MHIIIFLPKRLVRPSRYLIDDELNDDEIKKFMKDRGHLKTMEEISDLDKERYFMILE